MKFIKKIINTVKCKHGFHEGVDIEFENMKYAVCVHCKKNYVYVDKTTVILNSDPDNRVVSAYLEDVNGLVDNPFKLSEEDITMIDMCAPMWKDYCKMHKS